MKRCKKCKEFKPLDEFYKENTNKDGLQSNCKSCRSKLQKEYFRTKEGLITVIYGHQRSNSKRRKHKPPTYILLQLRNWIFSQKLFHKLYDNWVKSNYHQKLSPSVDRKDDYKPYSLDNIQLMTWQENRAKQSTDLRSGKLIHGHNPQKPVIQYDKQGNFIKEYCSSQQAYRETNICQSSISAACRGTYKSAGGYKWKFNINGII